MPPWPFWAVPRARAGGQDGLLQAPDACRHVEPEILAQPLARGVEHVEGVDLPTRPVQRHRQLGLQILVDGMFVGEPAKLADELMMPSQPEVGLDALLRPAVPAQRGLSLDPPFAERGGGVGSTRSAP